LAQVDEEAGNEGWRFSYDADYASSKGSVPLSISMPVRPEEYDGAVVRNWFSNLLPEGAVRDGIVSQFRLEPGNDFELLAAIGGECAGAVSITAPQSAAIEEPDDGEDLETLLLDTGTAGDENWAALAAPHRLSLAGAQDKLAVIHEPGGRLRLPKRGEISTHILKPESLRLKGLRDAEAFGLLLARRIGLQVAQALPISIAGREALLIERYDRTTRDGQTVRLHQEDFCQALGLGSENKYETRGGPSLARCALLIRELHLGPEVLQGFLDWVAFAVILGNADAHAKNLSILTRSNGQRSLAPFYDLVPTIFFNGRVISRVPAMRVGDAQAIDQVAAQDLRIFAKSAGYGGKFVLQCVLDQATQIKEQLAAVVEELAGQGANASRLAQSAIAVEANAQRLIQELA
jgi:serine/threonine-protein kinase HipA